MPIGINAIQDACKRAFMHKSKFESMHDTVSVHNHANRPRKNLTFLTHHVVYFYPAEEKNVQYYYNISLVPSAIFWINFVETCRE
jgi:hypothetical protein